MNKLIIILLLLVSCGTKKKLSEVNKSTSIEQSEGKSQTFSESQSVSSADNSEKTKYKLNLDDLGFSVKSPNGLPVYFNFSSGDQKFRAETNGEINFNRQKKVIDSTAKKKSKTKTKVFKVYKNFNVYKTITSYRTITRYKDVEVSRPIIWSYVLFVVIGIVVWEILRKKLKTFKIL